MLTKQDADDALDESKDRMVEAAKFNGYVDLSIRPRLMIAAEIAKLRWATIEAALMAEARRADVDRQLNPFLQIQKHLMGMAAAAAPVDAGAYGEAPLNEFLVSVSVGSGAIHFRPAGGDNNPEIMISADKALGLAAWLAALADPEGTKFPRILAAVLNS